MTTQRANSFVKVESEVPCDTSIDCWLHLHHASLDGLVSASRKFEQPYLAWETVRMTRNPFFEAGTGFEGYFVGICQWPEEALIRLLEVGNGVLASITRLYRFEYGFKSKLMKTLTGDFNDPKAIDVWAAQLGATVARLRCNLRTNPNANRFQTETYRLVNSLPAISYVENDHAIEQEYAIYFYNLKGAPRESISVRQLKPADQDAGLVVWSIGRFGHPLVREYLRQNGQSLFSQAS